MGHLLMLESWVGAMSTLLPRAILEAGHRFTFATRDLQYYLRNAAAAGPHPLLLAENILTAETNDEAALSARTAGWHDLLAFDGVITSCDYYLATAARLARELGLPGPDPAAVRRAVRKDLTRLALQDAGLPTPGFVVCADWTEARQAASILGYPLVFKPVDLCAGMYVRLVQDEIQLRQAFTALSAFPVNSRGQARAPQVVLEEVLDGPEVSVETVTVDGATHVVGLTDKSLAGAPFFVESGHMFPADLAADVADEAEAMAVDALAALGLDRGVAHTELRLTAVGPRVVEVNPRPAGNQITELVRRVTGVDLPMVAAQLAVGETPELTAARTTGVGSAAIAFLLPPRAGVIAGVAGSEHLPTAPEVVDWSVKPAGFRASAPSDNNGYLGHVMVTDAGAAARTRAEALVARLGVTYADEPAR